MFTEQTPAKTTPTTSLRTKTRAEDKRLTELREKNKLSQQKRRKNMSAQKIRREREKAKERYYRYVKLAPAMIYPVFSLQPTRWLRGKMSD